MDHAEIDRLNHLLRDKDQQIHMLHNRPREKEVVVETHEVINNTEINRLNNLLAHRDAEILSLANRPREKEIVVETQQVQVVDHAEIDRLTALLH